MKNFFVVSAVFCTTIGTSLTAFAQPAPNFIEGIELEAPSMAYTAPLLKQPVISSATGLVSLVSVATEACKTYQFKYALLLNREVESISNSRLFQFIEEWWDTRYRYGGTTKSGIDCSAFTSLLMAEVFQKNLPRTAKEQYSIAQKIDDSELAEGDLVFFNTRGGVSHVGVYLSEGYFVHASTSTGITINNLTESYYQKRYLRAARVM
jgi:hypothetical protein